MLGKIPVTQQFCPLQIQKGLKLESTLAIYNYSVESDRLYHETA